jgi:hypothetical protein
VVDWTVNQIVDVDPLEPGDQAISLMGLNPSLKMHLEADRRRLYVSTPGFFLDGTGGIEEIDLDTLTSLGFVTSEAQLVGDLGAFLMVSAEKGYVIVHTDLLLSSHLVAFSRIDGSHQGEIFVTLGVKVESLAFDPTTHQLFFPDPAPGAVGVRVFDTLTDGQLTLEPLNTGLPPWELIVARPEPPTGIGGESSAGPPGKKTEVWVTPQPVQTQAEFRLEALQPQVLEISLFDLQGRRLRTLPSQLIFPGQTSGVIWDGRDDKGRPVASGVITYLIRGSGLLARGHFVLVR